MEIYTTRYQAKKNKTGNDIIVKVEGGYVIMTPDQYRIWRLQK